MRAVSVKMARARNGRSSPLNGAGRDYRQWRDAVGYFKRVRRQLLRTPVFAHRFVAIHERQVWEVADNKFTLADKMRRKYPGKWFLVVRVEEQDEAVDVPSGVSR